MNTGTTTITNVQNTEFGSDLLNELGALAANSQGVQCDKKTIPNPGKKGEIITMIVVHLGCDLALDLLKLAAKRLGNHPNYDPLIQLNLNGSSVQLEDEVDR